MGISNFTVTNDNGHKLAGVEFFPEDEEFSHTSRQRTRPRWPAVIYVHGFGLKKSGFGLFDPIVDALHQYQLATFQFDFAGCGDSEGDYVDTSLTTQIADLKKIYDYVTSQPQIDLHQIYVVAHSFGCQVVMASGLQFTKAVFLGAIFNAQSVFEQIFESGYNPANISVKQWSDKWVTRIGSQFWSNLKNFKMSDLARQVRYPCLFLHGQADDKVPVSESQQYLKLIKRSKLIVIDKANHMMRPMMDQVVDHVITNLVK